jgi:eukaryotic-like serine/threonine-protein kinase
VLSPLTDADPAAVGTYRIQGRLGAGGMGAVYLGFGADDRPAAVKVIRPELAVDPEFRARFRREVAVARRVQGSFVAEVRDADVDADRPWMATEYVEGVSLARAVADRGRLAGAMLTGLATGLADALVAVHAAGLVHRDVKPSNILLAWDGPKLIDFGIARDLESRDQTRTGDLIGTVAWMAPEQFLGERAGPPADVFSWAVRVAFAATGRHPFPGSTPTASAVRSLNSEPDLEGVPPDLAALLRRALDRKPHARPGAVEVVSALLGEKVVGVVDADEATRRRLRSDWVAPAPAAPAATAVPAAGPVAVPAADRAASADTAVEPIAVPVAQRTQVAPAWLPVDGRSGSGHRRLALVGAVVLVLLTAGAGLGWALAAGRSPAGGTGNAAGPGTPRSIASPSPSGPATAGSGIPATTGAGTATHPGKAANPAAPAASPRGPAATRTGPAVPSAPASTPPPAPASPTFNPNGGQTQETVYHAAGNAAGQIWFNSGTANPSKGRNSFTVKDVLCGDSWSIYVQYTYTDAHGVRQHGSKYLSGDCNPVEWSGSVAGAQPAPLTFQWRGCKWDVNHKSGDTCEPWQTTTIR